LEANHIQARKAAQESAKVAVLEAELDDCRRKLAEASQNPPFSCRFPRALVRISGGEQVRHIVRWTCGCVGMLLHPNLVISPSAGRVWRPRASVARLPQPVIWHGLKLQLWQRGARGRGGPHPLPTPPGLGWGPCCPAAMATVETMLTMVRINICSY
jgi:hypothetical protein